MSKVTRWWWIRHAPVPDGGCIYGQRDLSADCTDSAAFACRAASLPAGAQPSEQEQRALGIQATGLRLQAHMQPLTGYPQDACQVRLATALAEQRRHLSDQFVPQRSVRSGLQGKPALGRTSS